MKFELKCLHFHSRKCLWKRHKEIDGHFVSTSMCWSTIVLLGADSRVSRGCWFCKMEFARRILHHIYIFLYLYQFHSSLLSLCIWLSYTIMPSLTDEWTCCSDFRWKYIPMRTYHCNITYDIKSIPFHHVCLEMGTYNLPHLGPVSGKKSISVSLDSATECPPLQPDVTNCSVVVPL